MKKILLPLLLIISTILITQVSGYSNEKVGDIKCSEIKNETRYPNLSPVLIGKIDLIGDKLNNKYKQKDEIYKDKIYDLYIKLLNENIVKTKYTDRQKEILLRIGDYFVCKKEELNNLDFVEGMLEGAEIDEETDNSKNNTTEANTEISNIQILNITDHSAKVTWEGNPEAITWLYVIKNGTTGSKHEAKNNEYIYPSLGSNYEFILHIQGKGSSKIDELEFKTLSKNGTINTTETSINSTPTSPISSTNNSIGKSKYLEEVNLPKCDSNNSEVFFIKTNDDWKHINDSDKRIFCVSPGDYRSLGSIQITRSGTKEKRRYIVLNNGNNTHPGVLPRNKYNLFFASFMGYNASYWTVDRASLISKYTGHTTGAIKLLGDSQYWIINRFYSYDINNSININNGAHNNTIQNSRFEDMRQSDAVSIELSAWKQDNVEIFNTKIVNNEFYNQNDGFQSVRSLSGDYPELRQAIRGDGTIVDSNQFYIDDKTTPTTENAIDLKFGSDDPDNPMIISNNIMWGYTGEGNRGDAALTGHYNVQNVLFENNILFNNASGWSSGSGGPPNIVGQKEGRTGLVNSKIRKNLFYNCGSVEINKYPFKNAANNTQTTENIFINNENGFAEFSGNLNASTFENNVICNTPNKWSNLGSNTSAFINTIKNNKHYTYCSDAGYTKDFVFMADRFTNNPREIRLENVLK